MNYTLIIVALLLANLGLAQDTRPAKPNVLFVLADDLGWQDVKCYDVDEPSPYETPHMDNLATEGVLFWQGYSPTPVCASTRCAILSGWHAARSNKTSVIGGHPPVAHIYEHSRLVSPWQRGSISTEQPNLATVLNSGGYTTGHSGKWHVNIKFTAEPRPKGIGFDWSRESMGPARPMKPNRAEGFATKSPKDPWRLDEQDFPTNEIFVDALAFMEESKAEPFFLFCASRLVHSPIQTRSKPLLEKYCKKLGVDLPTTPDAIKTKGQNNPYYCAMVEQFDHYVGSLLNYLKETDDPRWPGHKLSENTYVILTSDNGGVEQLQGEGVTDNSPLHEGKMSLAEGGVRVPFIISGPKIPANVQTEVMANGLDIFPTVLSMTGVEAPKDLLLDGCDLSSLLLQDPQNAELVKKQDGSARDTMVWHYPNGTTMFSTIREGGYKLIRYYDYINNPKNKKPFELFKLYEAEEGKAGRIDLEEAKDISEAMPEKVAELDAKLTTILNGMNAKYPYKNPFYKGASDHKENVPSFISEEIEGQKVKAKFTENGAKVVRAQVMYTTNGGDQLEEWFPVVAEVQGDTITATLPAGTTHYLFNVIDENNYLVSFPKLAEEKSYRRKPRVFSSDALSVK